MTGHIAVGLDGSRESLAAADWAAREARRRGLTLRLVHAGEGLAGADRETTGQGEPDLPELAVPRHWARRILRSAENDLNLRHPGLPIVAELVPDSPVAAMAEAGKRAELLVLGSRGLGGVTGFLVGSVALSTVAHADRPVALVRAGYRAEDERVADGDGNVAPGAPHRAVVLGLDAQSSCDPVIEFAFDTAACRRAPLSVVHIWHPPSAYADLSAGPHAHGTDAEAGERARRAVTVALRPWREKYPGPAVTELVRTGKPARNLIALTADAGLVVIGRRKRRSAVGAHLGSVAHMVIHHARCPVVVVPHD
ncbi:MULTISPECIES: universal stress protein [Streptomyces]|uniref:universal stress protein n=1 Tax=Streptomyces TaxID=1883 RepID=UPI0004C84963|nr:MULTISPECIES: universal stress protein [Streptomyces]